MYSLKKIRFCKNKIYYNNILIEIMENEKLSPCGAPFRSSNHILLTDHRPSKALYTNVTDSNAFRYYLQKNGTSILETERKMLSDNVGCTNELTWMKAPKFNVKPYEK